MYPFERLPRVSADNRDVHHEMPDGGATLWAYSRLVRAAAIVTIWIIAAACYAAILSHPIDRGVDVLGWVLVGGFVMSVPAALVTAFVWYFASRTFVAVAERSLVIGTGLMVHDLPLDGLKGVNVSIGGHLVVATQDARIGVRGPLSLGKAKRKLRRELDWIIRKVESGSWDLQCFLDVRNKGEFDSASQ